MIGQKPTVYIFNLATRIPACTVVINYKEFEVQTCPQFTTTESKMDGVKEDKFPRIDHSHRLFQNTFDLIDSLDTSKTNDQNCSLEFYPDREPLNCIPPWFMDSTLFTFIQCGFPVNTEDLFINSRKKRVSQPYAVYKGVHWDTSSSFIPEAVTDSVINRIQDLNMEVAGVLKLSRLGNHLSEILDMDPLGAQVWHFVPIAGMNTYPHQSPKYTKALLLLF